MTTDYETAEYRLWQAAKVQRATETRETLETAVSEALDALLLARAALAEFDREREGGPDAV